jgi:hypothetical protein
VCSLVLARVCSIHDFGSITTLSSDHTHDIGVIENNVVVMLSDSRTKGT